MAIYCSDCTFNNEIFRSGFWAFGAGVCNNAVRSGGGHGGHNTGIPSMHMSVSLNGNLAVCAGYIEEVCSIVTAA